MQNVKKQPGYEGASKKKDGVYMNTRSKKKAAEANAANAYSTIGMDLMGGADYNYAGYGGVSGTLPTTDGSDWAIGPNMMPAEYVAPLSQLQPEVEE